ncbi:MAG: serine/threonine-protein phosphatase [Oscillospiraceae bacterium]|nr:serine/threonine-protein phosphatase [Oscillospiraceae bacterium]
MAEKIERRLRENRYTLPASFIISVVLFVNAVLFCALRRFDGMESTWVFNCGADTLGIAICAVILFSILRDKRNSGVVVQMFVSILAANSIALYLDAASWLVQGVPTLRVLNIIVNVLYYANSIVIIYLFWKYVDMTLGTESVFSRWCSRALEILIIPALLACFVNLFYPLYFIVDEAGNYMRGGMYLLSLIYLFITVIAIIICLVGSKAPRRQKAIAASFITIPLLNQILTGAFFGISTQYAATLVSVVLIYGVLFTERGKTLAATESELNMAASIQLHMLPSIFPPFPERDDFDIFASMNPAKEVGGDFYDFFLIDDNHLGLVMADVSGKGVPAALFMMASKILIQNYALLGMSPKEVLESANNRICSNNREEMFVTVWFGSLDLTTGVLTCANAGHEYPVLKNPDGSFELIKDKHGFVIGGLSGVKYKEYELNLSPGSKLFLYTDGLPEATDAKSELFGTDRMLEALKAVENEAPQAILEGVDTVVNRFVGDAPQFDDLTMLCLEFRGKGEAENV